MDTQWGDWLRDAAAGGMGGKDIQLTKISRGLPWSHVFALPADYSADVFSADLRVAPDADATPLVSCTVTVGPYSDGYTNVTLSLTAAQTALGGVGDDNLDGIAEAIVNVLHSPAGGSEYRAIATNIEILE